MIWFNLIRCYTKWFDKMEELIWDEISCDAVRYDVMWWDEKICGEMIRHLMKWDKMWQNYMR